MSSFMEFEIHQTVSPIFKGHCLSFSLLPYPNVKDLSFTHLINIYLLIVSDCFMLGIVVNTKKRKSIKGKKNMTSILKDLTI